MKATFLLLAAISVSAYADEEVIPTSFSKERYAAMVEKSPFALATPVEAPKEPEKSIFDNTYVKGVGTGYVVVQRVGDPETMRFWGNTPNKEGIYVANVIQGDRPASTKVTLKKGTEEKIIGFNENELRSTAAAPAVPQPGGRSVTPGKAPGIAPGMAPAIPRPTIQPSVQVPRPPNSIQPQTNARQMPPQQSQGGNRFGPGGSTNASTNPGNDANGGRQRIRVIRN